MSKIQYVPDKESPFIKKLYGKEDNFKVETLTYFGTLYELEKLQNQIEVLEKALELACKELRDDMCLTCPQSHNCNRFEMCGYVLSTHPSSYYIELAKEMMKSE